MNVVRTTRLILDQGIPRDAAALLRERGYECTHLGEIRMSRASDEEILAWSLQQEAAVVILTQISTPCLLSPVPLGRP